MQAFVKVVEFNGLVHVGQGGSGGNRVRFVSTKESFVVIGSGFIELTKELLAQ